MNKQENFQSVFLKSVSGVVLITWIISFSACDFGSKEDDVNWDTLSVTASAYNSLDYQGEGDANITAWGDTLKPEQKVIAVSRDLIRRGLDYNTRVKIEGFKGEFLVKDKMNARWKNKIDIYMGKDSQKAREFGRKKLEIYYVVEEETPSE
ncbi:hypothetical protein RM545_15975 [Zunongwangia sp. F260]|uniref:3D (Asp-Asp-Asp) domain-containing protein n=1 Tax=Autumnicola lenta TaxID=3075593 RepID=A0ABU3CPM0_9FLAO|nr:hypothetical protein [Zunongwangia sp. F260]MDT0648192.1 hypothetical protein [Zunongwangia sp. F260]